MNLVNASVVAVPGFGYFSADLTAKIQKIWSEYGLLDNPGRSFSNSSQEQQEYMRIKCEVLNKSLPALNSSAEESSTKRYCDLLFDNASCFPRTDGGTTAYIPCMKFYQGVEYDVTANSSRFCNVNGTWDTLADYSKCIPLHQQNVFIEENHSIIGDIPDMINGSDFHHVINTTIVQNHTEMMKDNFIQISTDFSNLGSSSFPQEAQLTDFSHMIYYIGYILSTLALTIAILIFIYFRQLRCLRHMIHLNLFIAYWLSNIFWIISSMLQTSIASVSNEHFLCAICASLGFLHLFHLTTFFWMFTEGLNLFLQLTVPMRCDLVKCHHYLLMSWGSPVLITSLWTVFKIENKSLIPNETADNNAISQLLNSCPYLHDYGGVAKSDATTRRWIVEWIYQGPLIAVLMFNIFFLFWIMKTVISKIKDERKLETTCRNTICTKRSSSVVTTRQNSMDIELAELDQIRRDVNNSHEHEAERHLYGKSETAVNFPPSSSRKLSRYGSRHTVELANLKPSTSNSEYTGNGVHHHNHHMKRITEQHLKAAKALFIIIPLLGINYVITIIQPFDKEQYLMASMVFQITRAILLSTQGFIITLPYCFLSNEVRSLIKNRIKAFEEQLKQVSNST